jgi:signal transduction histidine kinase
MLQVVERSIEYSNKIINDLLEYSKEVKLELSETDPMTILAEVLSRVKVPGNVKTVNETRDEPRFKVDIEKMLRVFTNLTKNALDAMPNGGTMTIRSERDGNTAVFSFSDTGEGMSKETLAKLWTPLFTTKAKGMGFGLPICKRFVEGHGGRISAESEAGKGSTFTVVLPIEPNEEGPESWVNLPESAISTPSKIRVK